MEDQSILRMCIYCGKETEFWEIISQIPKDVCPTELFGKKIFSREDIFAEDIFTEDIFANLGQIRENIIRKIKVKLRIRENIFREIFSKMRFFFEIHVNLVQ